MAASPDDHDPNTDPDAAGEELDEARRRFLATCGKLAIITPPAIYSLTMATPKAHASGFSPTDPGSGGGGSSAADLLQEAWRRFLEWLRSLGN